MMDPHFAMAPQIVCAEADEAILQPLGAPICQHGTLVQELQWRDPATVFAALGDRAGTAFLDSAAASDSRGHYSYLCFDPVDTLVVEDPEDPDPIGRLRRLGGSGSAAGPLPFSGGVVGMIGYDIGRALLGVGSRHERGAAPALVARRYDRVLGFDNRNRKAFATLRDRSGEPARVCLARLRARTATIRQWSVPPLEWIELTDPKAYAQKIDAVLAYLQAGDIYQANFSTRFVARRPATFDPVAAYLRLRRLSPNPFGAYIDLGAGRALLSASPERFVQVRAGGRVETRPIKGTAPRYADPVADRAAAEALRCSGKDRSENLMICDLLRNDLASVSRSGSVRVTQLAELEEFASVWHLVSAVEAKLASDRDALDLLAATLPGGSITGAPKRRAVEIIDELEDAARGAMYGTVFRWSDDGELDSSIIIRSILVSADEVIAQAGGGIVAESEAESEYAELRAKADPLLRVGA